jgi:hypothetical protein
VVAVVAFNVEGAQSKAAPQIIKDKPRSRDEASKSARSSRLPWLRGAEKGADGCLSAGQGDAGYARARP